LILFQFLAYFIMPFLSSAAHTSQEESALALLHLHSFPKSS
jgi:hypothetical protein